MNLSLRGEGKKKLGDLSTRHSMFTVSRKFKESANRLTIIVETGNHCFDMINNFSQPSITLRFQYIKVPSLLGGNVGNKLGVRDDMWRGEQAICNGILIDTEPGAQSA